MEPSEKQHISTQLEKIATELRALRESTAQASSTILDCCDRILEKFPAHDDVTPIFEACAVQDLTEQRINKMLRIIARIENPALPADDELLEGPQSGLTGLSQEDTDRLMRSLEEGS